MFDFLVIGAGFSGSVCAERLASAGALVRLIERRSHIGGNAYDEYDRYGVLTHRHGPHIFHTNSERVVEYLSRFTEWRPYEHRVLASVGRRLVPFPINRTTLNMLYGLNLDEAEAQSFLERVRVPRNLVLTSEDVILNTIGRELYEMFFRSYTRKQWGVDPSELDPSVCGRIPVRTNSEDRYFTDKFQAMPLDGYTRMFQRMLDHPRITLELGTDSSEIRSNTEAAHVIYTGPIDAYFHFCFGRLPYRSLRFEHIHLPGVAQYQPVGTVNYPNEFDYTRITEFKHLTGQEHPSTSIVREFPQAEGEPYYPIPNAANASLYKRYEGLAQKEKDVTFVGRLAQYRYYNMDQAVAAALKVSAMIIVDCEVRAGP